MTEVIMPKMGDGMEEGTLLKWLKSDGDQVKSGDVIGEIQTDKATLELEAPGNGTLTGFLIQEGATVPVGVPIAAILKKGEALPKNWGQSATPRPVEAPAAPAPAATASEAPVSAPATPDRIKASPLARKLAADLGVELANLKGTGPGGRIVEKDVREAAGKSPAVAVSAPAVAAPAPLVAAAEDVRVPLNRLRQIIAERTTQSKLQAPHFYVTVEVDLERLMALREMFAAEESGRVSVNDFVVKASAAALREMPEVNATYQGDHVLRHGAVHVGIAAAIDEGLLVPVIKHADQLSLRQIAQRSRDLVAKARDGKLTPDEMSGSTFSISNMGMLDVDTFAAIINQPNSAIVAIGSARKKPVVGANDQIEVRTRMNITGSFDHRVLDGAVGAKFMNVLRKYLENPTRLLA